LTPTSGGARTITTPLLVVICSREGAWVTDVASRCYLDFLAGYSALNFGHRHPAPVDAAAEQLNRLTLTSRAFHHTLLGPFCRELAGTAMVLPDDAPDGGRADRTRAGRGWHAGATPGYLGQSAWLATTRVHS
jgi:ornithine--oxo-acid transaminase